MFDRYLPLVMLFLSDRVPRDLGKFRAMASPSHEPFVSPTSAYGWVGESLGLEWGLMAGLRGFASHGGCILSGGWLDTVEAPGYSRHPPSILSEAAVKERKQPKQFFFSHFLS